MLRINSRKYIVELYRFLNRYILVELLSLILVLSFIFPLFKPLSRNRFCLFYSVLGIDCPFCGLTRSFVAISHLQFKQGFLYNKAGIVIYISFIVLIITEIMLKRDYCSSNRVIKFQKIILLSDAITLLVNWLIYLI